MFNKVGVFLIMVGLNFSGNSAIYADPIHEDISHDQPQNDPSDPKKVLTLKKAIAQKDFAIRGTLKHLAELSIKGLTPTPILAYQAVTSWMEPDYQEILTDQKQLFQYFKINADRRTPRKQNGPTTVNADHEYRGISDRRFGYCWGYATLVRYFTQIAFYDGSLKRPSLKKTFAEIDQILEGKPAVISGYSNLRELTLVPEVEFYLKLAAMELWRARTIKFKSIGITMKSTNWMSFDEVEALAKDLETRIKRGEFPKIIFASLIPTHPLMGMNTDIHVVPAYRVERLENRRIRIHLWDINFYAETLERKPKFLEIDSNHQITYAPYVEKEVPYAYGSDIIGRVILAPENDSETASMLNGLKRFCTQKETAVYCAKKKGAQP
jgi:hypothetical protein